MTYITSMERIAIKKGRKINAEIREIRSIGNCACNVEQWFFYGIYCFCHIVADLADSKNSVLSESLNSIRRDEGIPYFWNKIDYPSL